MNAKHTQLPWSIGTEYDTTIPIYGGSPLGAAEYLVAEVVDANKFEQNAANAAFIVRACNGHYEALAALKAADQFITNGIELGYIRMPDADTSDTAHQTPGIVRAAIAKAEA